MEAAQEESRAARTQVAVVQAECWQEEAGEPVSSPSARISMVVIGAGQPAAFAAAPVQMTS
jgi:hypothetical protein